MLKHGQRRVGRRSPPEYIAWKNMKQRCYDRKSKDYEYYGARGIYVCEAWRRSFIEFRAHVGRRPSKRYSLDRIDSERGYEPGNVRWSDATVQSRNRRCAKLTQFDVDWVRHMSKVGLNTIVLSKAVGVSSVMIGRILSGKAWRKT
jgi:hypothetical protein